MATRAIAAASHSFTDFALPILPDSVRAMATQDEEQGDADDEDFGNDWQTVLLHPHVSIVHLIEALDSAGLALGYTSEGERIRNLCIVPGGAKAPPPATH